LTGAGFCFSAGFSAGAAGAAVDPTPRAGCCAFLAAAGARSSSLPLSSFGALRCGARGAAGLGSGACLTLVETLSSSEEEEDESLRLPVSGLSGLRGPAGLTGPVAAPICDLGDGLSKSTLCIIASSSVGCTMGGSVHGAVPAADEARSRCPLCSSGFVSSGSDKALLRESEAMLRSQASSMSECFLRGSLLRTPLPSSYG